MAPGKLLVLTVPRGVTFKMLEAGPVPTLLAAVTEQAYKVPPINPLSVMGEPLPDADIAVPPTLGVQVAV